MTFEWFEVWMVRRGNGQGRYRHSLFFAPPVRLEVAGRAIASGALDYPRMRNPCERESIYL